MKSSLLLFGAFAVAYNAANALHELGHACAVWLTGGTVASVHLSPFLWNRIWFSHNPHPEFTAWGGVLFGSIFAIALTALSLSRRSSYCAAGHLLASCSLGVNGVYLVVGVFAKVGDAGLLMHFGTPGSLLLALGLALIVVSCLWLSLVQPLVGLGHDVSLARRIAILQAGVSPYLLLMLLYCGLADRSQFTLCAAFTGGGVVVVFLVALCAHVLASRVRVFSLVEPTRGAVATSLVLAATIVAGELVFFPRPWT